MYVHSTGPVRGKFRQATRPWNSDARARKWRQATTRCWEFPTAKLIRNEPTANSVFSHVSTAKSLCARRNVPVGSPFVRVAVTANTHRDRTASSAIQELRSCKECSKPVGSSPLTHENVLRGLDACKLSQHRRNDVTSKFRQRHGNLPK